MTAPSTFAFGDPRQERIYRLLGLIGPGPAAFYRDACWMMSDANPLESTTHLVAHLLREIESSIRDVLETVIYAFWHGKKCLYVGKRKGYRRLKHYEKSVYLIHADCIEVWVVGGKARLPRAECLAIHLFSPRDNKQKKAARVK